MSEETLLRKDLKLLEPKMFYMKHIVKSHNWYFSEYLHFSPVELVENMDSFKEIVSSRLDINFHNVQIVGSAKTGYSLSPKKLLKPFHDETDDSPSSDIDIALISERLYHILWSELREVKGLWHSRYYYNHLTESIFRGYINDKDLLKIDEIGRKWEDMIRPVNVQLQDTLGFVHPISYRVYRSWDDLEDYQLNGIRKAKEKLEEN